MFFRNFLFIVNQTIFCYCNYGLYFFKKRCKDNLFNDKIVSLQRKFYKMNEEKHQYEGSTNELVDEEKSLILLNDDVNTFDYVIYTLIEVCGHTMEQAETCAWITHYKGRCAVKSGSFDELKPYYDCLINRHLSAKIQ